MAWELPERGFWKILQSEQTGNRTAGGKTLANPETDVDVDGDDVDFICAAGNVICTL